MGKCGFTTTGFALPGLGADAEDAHYMARRELFDTWFRTMRDNPDTHAVVEDAWPSRVQHLTRPRGRWNKVTSLMGNVIATLLNYQWTPSTPWS